MLGVDPKHVGLAEPGLEVSIVNDKTWCKQFASLKQSDLFHRNCNEHQVENRREVSVTLKTGYVFSLQTVDLMA